MKPGIFEIFRIKFRDIQKKIGNFRKHIQAIFVIFVPTIVGLTGAFNDGFHLNALKIKHYVIQPCRAREKKPLVPRVISQAMMRATEKSPESTDKSFKTVYN